MEKQEEILNRRLNLCVNRMREVFPKVSLERLEDLNVCILSNHKGLTYKPKEHLLEIGDKFFDTSEDSEMMDKILEIITTKEEMTEEDRKLEGLKSGIRKNISHLLIPEEESYQNLVSKTFGNLTACIVTPEVVLSTFFEDYGIEIYQTLKEKLKRVDTLNSILELVNMEVKKDVEKEKINLGEIQFSMAGLYIAQNSLSDEEVTTFRNALFTDVDLLPEGMRKNFASCASCGEFVDNLVRKKREYEKSEDWAKIFSSAVVMQVEGKSSRK